MCGIVGVINYRSSLPLVSQQICRVFDEALWADTIRGADATGMMALTAGNKLDTLKTSGPYGALLHNRRYSSIQNFTDTNYFTIGHNRSATRGDKGHDDNAHPFTHDKIALVHNGTLTHFHEDYKDSDWKKNVDSKALTKIIAEHGLVEGTKYFHGAYAIVWIDEGKRTLNIARNNERPLGWVMLKDYMLIGSEPHMMAWLAVRNNLKVFKLGYFEPQKLHTYHATTWDKQKSPDFDGEKIAFEDLFDIVDVPETKPVFTAPQPTTSGRGWGKWGGTNINKKDKIRMVSKLNIGGSTILEKGDLIEFVMTSLRSVEQGNFVSFNGRLIEPATREEVLVTGNVNLDWREAASCLDSDKDTFFGEVAQLGEGRSGSLVVQVREVIKAKEEVPVPAIVKPATTTGDKEVAKILKLPLVPKQLSLDTKGNFTCCGCKNVFPESMRRIWKRATYNDKARAYENEVFNLCPGCIVTMASDETMYDKLTKQPTSTRMQ